MAQLAKTTRVQEIRDILERLKPGIVQALPKHMNADRLVRIAMTSVRKNPQLLKCTPESLCACLLTCSQRGLEPDSSGQQAHLIPYGTECTLIFGFRGLMELALRHKDVLSFDVPQVVYKGDDYVYKLGLEPKLEHTPGTDTKHADEDVVAFYVVARLASGATPFVWMWNEQVLAVRNAIKDWQKKPWKKHYQEQGKKTVIRRFCKVLPASADLQAALGLELQTELGKPQTHDYPFVDVEIEAEADEPERLSVAELREQVTKPTAKPQTKEKAPPPAPENKHKALRIAIRARHAVLPVDQMEAALKNVGLKSINDIDDIVDIKVLQEVADGF